MNKRYPRQLYISFFCLALAGLSFFAARTSIFPPLISFIASLCAVLFLLVTLFLSATLLFRERPKD